MGWKNEFTHVPTLTLSPVEREQRLNHSSLWRAFGLSLTPDRETENDSPSPRGSGQG